MAISFTDTARKFGLCSSIVASVLIVAYGITLAIGFMSLQSSDAPIGDPMFTILEVLILALMPSLVGLMVAVHAWASERFKVLSLVAVTFMGLLAVVTCSVHFVILTVSRTAAFAGQPWVPLFLSFRWPSVAYALDILAWDIFFPLSMFLSAPALVGSRLADWIRVLMILSGVLSLAGLGGVVFGDMQLRNIGILGYVGMLLVVTALLGVLFYRTGPREA